MYQIGSKQLAKILLCFKLINLFLGLKLSKTLKLRQIFKKQFKIVLLKQNKNMIFILHKLNKKEKLNFQPQGRLMLLVGMEYLIF